MDTPSFSTPAPTAGEALRVPVAVKPGSVQCLKPPHVPALDTFKARPNPGDRPQAWLLRLP